MRLPSSTIADSGGNSPIIAIADTDLPLPDSPTRATVVFERTLKLTPLTASKVCVLSRRKRTLRSQTSSNSCGSAVMASDRGFEFGVERVAQCVGEQAESSDQYGHARGCRGKLPPL